MTGAARGERQPARREARAGAEWRRARTTISRRVDPGEVGRPQFLGEPRLRRLQANERSPCFE